MCLQTCNTRLKTSSIFFLYIDKNQLFRPRWFRINATITTLFSAQFCKRPLAQVELRIGHLSFPDSVPRVHNIGKTPKHRLRFCGKGCSQTARYDCTLPVAVDATEKKRKISFFESSCTPKRAHFASFATCKHTIRLSRFFLARYSWTASFSDRGAQF